MTKPGKSQLDMDLNLLAALDALLQEQSVTRAAERAGVSQPSMSRSLKRLRVLLKDELLVRLGNTLYPTSYATNLIEPVHGLIAEIGCLAENRPQFNSETDSRVFTIAASEYAMLVVLRPLMELLAERARRVSLRVLQLHKDTFELLQHGQLDFAIGPRPEDRRYPTRELLRDRVMCAMWGGNPETAEHLLPEAFLPRPQLIQQADGYWYMAPEALPRCPLESLSPDWGIEDRSFMLPFLMDGTHCVSLVPERIGKSVSLFGSLRMEEPPFQVEPIVLHMSWHPRSNSDPAHAWLRELLVTVASAGGCADPAPPLQVN